MDCIAGWILSRHNESRICSLLCWWFTSLAICVRHGFYVTDLTLIPTDRQTEREYDDGHPLWPRAKASKDECTDMYVVRYKLLP